MTDKEAPKAEETAPPEINLGPRQDPEITAAQALSGQTLLGVWNIQAPIDRSSSSNTPLSGMNFSACYEAIGPEGESAIVKAFDFERHMGALDPISEVGFYTRMFEHERDMLKLTTGLSNTARRVVRLYGDGQVLGRFEGESITVPIPFLILEKANVDVRVLLSNGGAGDYSWRLRCLRDVASALNALHTEGIAHGDTKPSNVMYFRALEISKLGDMGSSTGRGAINPALTDRNASLLGDTSYAPLEFHYSHQPGEWNDRFLAIDLFLLGQLALYFLTLENMTTRIIEKLPLNHRPKNSGGSWHGTFQAILPHLETAYGEVLDEISSYLGSQFKDGVGEDIVKMIGYLCHPDPAQRGHYRNQDPLSAENPYGLMRFVSFFNMAYRKAAIQERTGV